MQRIPVYFGVNLPQFTFILFISLTFMHPAVCQQPAPKIISITEAVKIALANSPIARNAELRVQAAKTQKLSGIALGNTDINYINGQVYSATNDQYLEINQHFGSPLTHIQKGKYNKQVIKLSESEQKLAVKRLTADVKISYTNLLYQVTKLKTIKDLSPLYNEALNISGVPYNLLDTNQLKRVTAETHFAEFQNQLFQAEQDCHLAGNQLQQILNVSEDFVPADSSLELYAIEILNSGPDKFYPASNLSLYNEAFVLCQTELRVEQSKLFPEITGGYFNHEINHQKGFQGIRLGVALPVWYFPQKARIKEAQINEEMARNELDYQKFNLIKTIENLKIQLDKYFVQISFYRENALHKADLLVQTANQQFQRKEIDYSTYFEDLKAALKIQLDYLEEVKLYNQTAIELESYID